MRDQQGRAVVRMATSAAAPTTQRLIPTQVFPRSVAAGGSRIQHVSAECSCFGAVAGCCCCCCSRRSTAGLCPWAATSRRSQPACQAAAPLPWCSLAAERLLGADVLQAMYNMTILRLKTRRSNEVCPLTRHTSHVTRHTSHVTRHTSHVTRHTSHVAPTTRPLSPRGSCDCAGCRLPAGGSGTATYRQRWRVRPLRFALRARLDTNYFCSQ
jgi:hypothetical protein